MAWCQRCMGKRCHVTGTRQVGLKKARDRLVVRMFLVVGLRPGELFALRRDDKMAGQIRINESVSSNRMLVEPKTESSISFVRLSKSIETALDFWPEAMDDKRPEAFIFATKNATH